ncbi:MAG: glucokinase [Gammaproteobacteria bacterium]|nr:glucokinase [Gammaproteobacteria bacterium]
MILAGDIGGTKTVLALYGAEDPIDRPFRSQRFASGNYAGLEPIIAEFLRGVESRPCVGAFGIAGPIQGRSVQTTNLPWLIDADDLEKRFSFRAVDLLNDLQATASAVPFLSRESLCTLNDGDPDTEGPITVIAPGTGLGMALLVPTEEGYRALPSEGGHMSFSPTTGDEVGLLVFLLDRFGHVSFERICSGSGLPNVYDYLASTGRYDEPNWLRDQFAAAPDRTPVIVSAALAHRSALCDATLDLFVTVLGNAIGNVALLTLPTGGIYLGGGIPPRILERLRREDFLSSMVAKGRSRTLLERLPVHVILDAQAALHGAAWHARRKEGEVFTAGTAG